MKELFRLWLLLLLPLPACALTNGNVIYRGGTLVNIAIGTVGRLDTASDTSLIFEFEGGRLAIPYAAIDSYRYSKEVTHHLGVLPAIAIGLVKARQHRHRFRISYRDEKGSQVAIFEVPKATPGILEAILQARAPATCKPHCPASAAR